MHDQVSKRSHHQPLGPYGPQNTQTYEVISSPKLDNPMHSRHASPTLCVASGQTTNAFGQPADIEHAAKLKPKIRFPNILRNDL